MMGDFFKGSPSQLTVTISSKTFIDQNDKMELEKILQSMKDGEFVM